MRRAPEGGPFGLGRVFGMLGRRRRRGADPHARVAALELDLRERDAELGRLRAEYRRLADRSQRARAEAATAGVEALLARLARPLSQLATMQVLYEGGRAVGAADVFKLVDAVEAALLEAGAARVGALGEQVAFDPELHQPLAEVELRPGEAVRIRFLGYRLGQRVLLRAEVSPSGAPEGGPSSTGAGGDHR